VFRSPMIPLRVIAIISNILFNLFGLWAPIYPVMLLHLILLAGSRSRFT
jgi:hypothetical protein